MRKRRYVGVVLPTDGSLTPADLAAIARELCGRTAESKAPSGQVKFRFKLGGDPLEPPPSA